ncbi:MAG: DUF2461 domain-containing protein [Paludibacteraceae bacterium]
MIKNILLFLSELKKNNNRDWFTQNKVWYEQVKSEFEVIGSRLITEIAKFDDEVKHVEVKECVFRIYRDIRFSADKTPYKTHFGIYIASAGGRKSPRGGYYLHIDPEQSFFGGGVWMPQPDILKALRQSVFDNIDEFNEIVKNPEFQKIYPKLNEEGKMKKIPAGFPTNFPDADLLKNKSFLVDYVLSDQELYSENFVATLVRLAKTAYPFLSFLNYTVDEVLGIN